MDAVIRPYTQEYCAQVKLLLKDLPLLYPGFDQWLNNRLVESMFGNFQVRNQLALIGDTVVGISIDVSRLLEPGNVRKLSTLFVAPDFRRRGIGTKLVQTCVQRWSEEEVARVTLTVRCYLEPQLIPLISKFDFYRSAIEYNRYGPGEHEVTYTREVTSNHRTKLCTTC